MKFLNLKKGLTLIETLIYVAIFTMFVTSLFSFSERANLSKLRNQTMLEVNYQGSQVIDIITQSIRNATSTSNPAIGNSSDSLVINTLDPLKNPTIFSIATGTLYIKEGPNDLVALTNDRVEMTDLVFSNYSRTSTPGTIKIRFNLKNADAFNKPEQQYTKTFYGSASIR